MDNPFTRYPILKPKHLIGRDLFLEELEDNLNQGSVLLFGGQRSGKTSILKSLIEKNKSTQKKWLYWDAHSFAINGGLSEVLKSNSISSIDDYIEEVGELVLLIDEFDILGETNRFTESDFENLRAILTDKGLKFVILAATSTSKVDIEMHGSNLLNMFDTVYMPPLECANSSEFYQTYLEESSELYKDKKELFELAGMWAGLHPWLLQIAGSVVFRSKDKEQYYEKIRMKQDDVYRWAKNLLNKPSIGEFDQARFYIRTITDNIDLEKHPFETLGIIAHGIIPGVLSLAANDWFLKVAQNIPPEKRKFVSKAIHELQGKSINDGLKHPYFYELLKYGVLKIDEYGIIKGI